MQKASLFYRLCFSLLCLLYLSLHSYAQQVQQPLPGAPVTLQNAPQRDTSNKTNTSQWKSENARISFKKLNSQKVFHPDTSLQTFHRRPFQHLWMRDLGNLGSPANNLFFTPTYRTGPTLGYHAFDVYRFHVDSLYYYNTNRPYSIFTYQLGSRAEQRAEVLHTQNILPNWNMAIQYRKVGSPGNYKLQRTNHDLANLTTNYQSRDQHYKLNAAVVYNKLQHDENGGIVSDSFLNLGSFDDRRTIPVLFQNDFYSNRRSSVTNTQRDFTMLLQHSYTIGKADTTYNEDSTQYSYRLIPRFRISHRFQLSSEKYQFKDLRPDSIRYSGFFNRGFAATDSVFMEQKWFYFDNAILLNGFLGSEEKQLQFTAGFGNRFDRFRTEFVSRGDRQDVVSNYIVGEIKKEALEAGQWFYNAQAKFFLTGNAAGNLLLRADVGKDISSKIGNLNAGFEQQINNAPYNYIFYQNQYYQQTKEYNKETVTLLHGTVNNDFLKLSAGLKNYLLTNYIYLDQQQQFSQSANAFSLTQIWLKKVFAFGVWVLDNDVAYQQKAGEAPLNVPAVMGRHRLSIETRLFGNTLKIATGIDLRWHTAYEPAAYSPFFNRFYYQNTYNVSNAPETALFFNFKIKNFRAYIMGDQLQSFFARNVIAAPGYPTQDAMLRFGFSWVMVN
ncbi:MAG TPA: hypothetical protein PL009_10225 [Flavipsychrobacter sp.]|nr:hypothetical protein [Flavipsychrobacter sp.]